MSKIIQKQIFLYIFCLFVCLLGLVIFFQYSEVNNFLGMYVGAFTAIVGGILAIFLLFLFSKKSKNEQEPEPKGCRSTLGYQKTR